MKIDLSPPMPDREPPLRTAPRDDDARRDQGRAFDAAVRDAKPPQRDTANADNRASAPSAQSDASAKPTTSQYASSARASEAKAGEATSAKRDAGDGKDTDPNKDADAADSTQAEGADKRALQSLLGLLNHSGQPSDDKRKASEQDAATRTLVPSGAEQGLDPTGGEGTGGKSVRLEVLKMETHFEPHQDGMVLVQAKGDEAARKAAADAKSAGVKTTTESSASAVLASLSDKAKASSERVSTKGAAATGDGQQPSEAPLPLRFDEALARLSDRGRAGADQGGERRSDAQRAASLDAAKGSDTATGGKTLTVDALAAGGSGAGGLGIATQIADRMLEVLGEPNARPSSAATPDQDAHLRMRAGGAALKTLTIQLKPEHLGTLDVSMRLSEGKLTVELAASRADTAVLLAEDRGALRQLLERAGFSLDDAAITVVAKDIQANAPRAADGSTGAGNDNSSSNGASGQAARDGSPSRDEQPNGRRSPETPTREGTVSQDASRTRRASTYL
ncbi:flagellar hook-length control protein FliK [Aureimonas sp. N4]|uniref:flagellar hook-length control protein FliK n=1 Tax=Aureimonas sp. N4 TaxID=1638165 RepID=UPI0007808E70|nr:flagellar hook-length control protein FliK [Aureimonas sp. N4]